MKHKWRIKKIYFEQLFKGKKSIEVRVGYSSITKVRPGDTIAFENYGPNEFRVVNINRYKSFEEMLDVEGTHQVLPGYSKAAALRILRSIYPPEKEQLGVYAFRLHNLAITEDKRFYSAANLLKDGHNLFSKVVSESYAITDWISCDYPKHFEHYWNKYVPGIFTGEREIISVYVGKHIAGTIILKKDIEETKICTLYVKDEFRGQGIATSLLERAFDWLGTTKPVITIADYKVNNFEALISKYGWKLSKTLCEGYYNNHSTEFVYNATD